MLEGNNQDVLVKEYQTIKDRIAKIESDRIKTQTELDLKDKELEGIKEELKELGITDLENIDKIVEERKAEFEKVLNELKEKLIDVQWY